jgi:hypothetical protein
MVGVVVEAKHLPIKSATSGLATWPINISGEFSGSLMYNNA